MERRDTGKIILIIVVIVLGVGMVGGAWYVSGRLASLEQQNELLASQGASSSDSNSSTSGTTLGAANTSTERAKG